MNKDIRKKQTQKFICSICLNNRADDNKTCRSCPICERNLEIAHVVNSPSESRKDGTDKYKQNFKTKESTVQTSLTDINQGLTLLHEVLNVFQCRKKTVTDGKETDVTHTSTRKSVCVCTECRAANTKLAVTKVLQHSISAPDSDCSKGKFTIISSSQPNKSIENSINISKQKSSSIPQMKLEELKNAMKEKTKSKDAIEEVNRMFATVKKAAGDDTITNRPLIRHGPRVLPVVKPIHQFFSREDPCSEDNLSELADKKLISKVNQCSQVSNLNMCSGDSVKNSDKCCQHCKTCEKNKRSVYMLCCNYKNHVCEMKRDVPICECCLRKIEPKCCDDSVVDGICRSDYNSSTGF
ncbi:hypothetical protein JYU34_001065 [Plutella xylostella]|uniref:Uncharacterized protein n=1 Tax=Plutella xylostella TaxID=51655 RepID=A0ABQ7R5W6_PLUXY|nr:hypothetical protein JYU34_001065 [Plutella xylostella]